MRKTAHSTPAVVQPAYTPPPARTVSGICGAPPGGCGGGPRRRVTVDVRAGVIFPSCPSCGSEMIRVKAVDTGPR